MVQSIQRTTPQNSQIFTKTETVLRNMFDNVCQAVETIDGDRLHEQHWTKNEQSQWVKGKDNNGIIYVDKALRNGKVFEKVGINYVSMQGELPPGMIFQGTDAVMADSIDQKHNVEPTPFCATSTSVVINAKNPMVPTAHVNYRYFQIGDGTQPGSWWFGGGGDLTPIYLFEEDAVHFHLVHKRACDKHDSKLYPRFKQWCDEYFYLPHRQECRGVGGIFFDNLQEGDAETLLELVKTCSEAFIPSYIPIVEKRKDMKFTEQNKYWQHIRRGRYAEFILMHDRGVQFGLASGIVNTQSVLNCMPGEAFWNYDDRPVAGGLEAKLVEILKNPKSWV